MISYHVIDVELALGVYLFDVVQDLLCRNHAGIFLELAHTLERVSFVTVGKARIDQFIFWQIASDVLGDHVVQLDAARVCGLASKAEEWWSSAIDELLDDGTHGGKHTESISFASHADGGIVFVRGIIETHIRGTRALINDDVDLHLDATVGLEL